MLLLTVEKLASMRGVGCVVAGSYEPRSHDSGVIVFSECFSQLAFQVFALLFAREAPAISPHLEDFVKLQTQQH